MQKINRLLKIFLKYIKNKQFKMHLSKVVQRKILEKRI